MQYTLLDLTQSVLSSMDSDAVNSITDTAESSQVATLIRTAFFDLVSRGNLPENYTWFNLVASADPTKPTLMTLPTDAISVMWVKYDKSTVADPDMDYENVNPLSREEFFHRMYTLNESETNVGTFPHIIDDYTANILFTNDAAPTNYSLFNDSTLIFNSFDGTVDSTLQSSKTLAYGKKAFAWTMDDGFVPSLDDEQFALLLNESKSLAWSELKQAQHTKAEQAARRGWTHLQKTKNAIALQSDLEKLPNFGRK